MARFSSAASAAALTLMLAHASLAQTYRDAGGSVVPGVVPVGGDGSGPLFTPSNPGKISGAFSATLSGFQPTPAYSAEFVATSSSAHPLPAGPVVIFYNTGANPITVKLGGSEVNVSAGQADVIQPNAWMAFAVGSATYYAVVGNGGASTVVASGGTGLPTGAGGGGGSSSSSGGGVVTQGAQDATAVPWKAQLYADPTHANDAIHGVYVQPGTGAMWSIGSGPANVTATDCSGATSGADATATPIAAQTALHGFVIKNIDTSEALWFSMTGTASSAGTGSYPLGPATATTYAGGESFTTPSGFGLNHAVSVFAHTSGHKFSCTWW